MLKERTEYRDAYKESRDKPWNDFKSVESLEVDGRRIRFRAKSDKGSEYFSFDLKWKEYEIVPDAEFMNEWEEKFEAAIEEALKKHTREALMPDYVKNCFTEHPMLPETGEAIPYEKARLVAKVPVRKKCEGRFIIVSQIDHCAGYGIQREYVLYYVDSEGNSVAKKRATLTDLQANRGVELKIDDIT